MTVWSPVDDWQFSVAFIHDTLTNNVIQADIFFPGKGFHMNPCCHFKIISKSHHIKKEITLAVEPQHTTSKSHCAWLKYFYIFLDF